MNIGFIGTGNMGRHMARNLINAGHHLTVHDLKKEATQELLSLGADWAATPSAAAQAGDLVFTSLPGPQEVEHVVLGEGGILDGARVGTHYFDLSTVPPSTTQKIAAIAKSRGVIVLDSPVSGGTNGAEQGTLCVMVGGDEAVFRKYESVLSTIGDKVTYCGELGSGNICKIVNNLLSLSLNVMLSEAFTLGVKAGVSPAKLYEAVSKSSGSTRTMERWPRTIFKGDFTTTFALDLASKDVHLAVELAREMKMPLDLGNMVEQRYIEAQGRGWGAENSLAVARLQEEKAGTPIREPS